MLHFRRLDLLRIDANGGRTHGTRVHESVMRNRGYRRDVVLVHIVNLVYSYIIIYIGYIDDIHRGIRYVHVLHVALARAVGRNVHFARTEREPCDASPSATDRQGHAESRSADKDNPRRSIHGPHNYGTRNPAPASADFGPTPIVKWSKTPGFVFHPGPTPRRDPRPVTEAVRRPSHGDASGKPHSSVVGHFSPLAFVIGVSVADDFARDRKSVV